MLPRLLGCSPPPLKRNAAAAGPACACAAAAPRAAAHGWLHAATRCAAVPPRCAAARARGQAGDAVPQDACLRSLECPWMEPEGRRAAGLRAAARQQRPSRGGCSSNRSGSGRATGPPPRPVPPPAAIIQLGLYSLSLPGTCPWTGDASQRSRARRLTLPPIRAARAHNTTAGGPRIDAQSATMAAAAPGELGLNNLSSGASPSGARAEPSNPPRPYTVTESIQALTTC